MDTSIIKDAEGVRPGNTLMRVVPPVLHTSNETLVPSAAAFAAHYHLAAGQRRKWSGRPYIEHPAMVATLVSTIPGVPMSRAAIAAAWLHDTAEDTDATIEEIRFVFGDEVAELVRQLTKVTGPMDGSRRQRHALELERAERMTPEAKTIKLADIADNCRSVAELCPEFASIYLPERFDYLAVLKGGDPSMWEMTSGVLMDAADNLNLKGIR